MSHSSKSSAWLAVVAAALVACSPSDDEPVGGPATDTGAADVIDDGGPTDAEDTTADTSADTALDIEAPKDSGPIDVPPADPCPDLCKPLAGCTMDLLPAECSKLCKDDPAGTHKVCLQNSECKAVADCLGLHPKVILPFDEGTSGLLPRRLAGAFTVTTDGGEFDFRVRWTGQESYVFVRRVAGDAPSEALWEDAPAALLKASPQAAHYFFMATREADGSDKSDGYIKDLATRLDKALAALPASDSLFWRKHVHLVPVAAPRTGDKTTAKGFSGWLDEVFRKRSVHHIAIDRLQRVRDVGPLAAADPKTDWTLAWLAHEVAHYEFEFNRHKVLAGDSAVVVPVIDAKKTASAVEGYAELPDKMAMAKYDTLQVQLALHCNQNLDSSCGTASLPGRLFLCDLPSAATPDHAKTDCTHELGRWMTPYGREGAWVTDVSAALAWLQAGGKRRLRWAADKQDKKCFDNKICIDTVYVPTVNLRLMNAGKGMRPVASVPAFQGGPFGAGYNDKYAPLKVEVPAGTKKVALYALITGHGDGLNGENCAGSCNHTHHFTVGGKTFVRAHPSAGGATGCLDRLNEGVVPNQFGPWPGGYGGWCPGLDVTPWQQDITAQVTIGGSSTLTYKALFDGKDYAPTPAAGGSSAKGGTIEMRSYVVFYQ